MALCFCVATVDADSPAPTLKPWVTRQTTFNIPFSVDLSRGMPREVQLFVSQDAGKTWHFYGRQVPTAKNFPFRAAGDGDFWFTSRTIDPQRSVPPVEQLRPELHVQVDTKQPQMEFTAVAGSGGEVTTAWKVADPTLDPKSLTIDYQTVPGGAWRSVAIDNSKSWSTPGSLLGEMTWFLEGEASNVTVRAEVADGAGNKSVVNRQVTLSRVPNRAISGAGGVQNSTTPVAQIAPSPIVDGSNQNSSTASFKPTIESTRWPANNQLRAESANGTSADQGSELGTQVGEVNTGRYEPEAPGVSSAVTSVPDAATTSSNPEYSARSSLPPGERARMTNSLHFQLDYELDSVGPEGVDEVQLWGSKDFGQTWVRWSLDDDLRSPLEVHVESEGIYGFRVVIVGRNGLATPAPHQGDLADIWVGVDTTRPIARISSAAYGDGVHAGELDIRWEIIDESIGERAVTLLFSEHPTGPWTTIAAGLPNTQQYYWSVDPNTPREIYLRLEVRDEAGNTAEHQLVEPISTTGLVPKAFIRSVRPVAEKPREAFLRNQFYQAR
ncbi:MAG: hypothetical protein H6822_34190 [Planctomycetaceae bacterium]|nr:hypothetical protein [Planctomycetales bacterium]MCB9927236.1 hypothetical protein [Planctomycetaceae bacterium]